jgi:hypothetical protein
MYLIRTLLNTVLTAPVRLRETTLQSAHRTAPHEKKACLIGVQNQLSAEASSRKMAIMLTDFSISYIGKTFDRLPQNANF